MESSRSSTSRTGCVQDLCWARVPGEEWRPSAAAPGEGVEHGGRPERVNQSCSKDLLGSASSWKTGINKARVKASAGGTGDMLGGWEGAVEERAVPSQRPLGGFDDWGGYGRGGQSLSQAWWKVGGALGVMEGGAGWRVAEGCLDVAPLGEPPRPDELPDQPHPHHPRGDGVHPAQQGAGAGRERRLRQGGVAAGSPRPTGGGVVDGQEPRSPQSWKDVWALTPVCPWVRLQPLALSGAWARVCLPRCLIRLSHKGLGAVLFRGPNSSGALRPSTPGLLHAES